MRAFSCGLTIGFVAMALACGGAGKNSSPKEEAKKTYTRDEFRKLVVGKSQDDVLKAFGKPKDTQDRGRSVFWYYDEVTVDPVTNKKDNSAQVCFENGVVTSVNY